MIMEYLPMDMFTFMDVFKADLDDNIASVVISELLVGLNHMATHRITHRDLKPENVLIDLSAKVWHAPPPPPPSPSLSPSS